MTVVPVEMNSKTLSRELDATERRQEELEREMAEIEARGDEIPEDIAELSEANRLWIEELREKIGVIAVMEKLNRKFKRRRKDQETTAVPAGAAAVTPSLHEDVESIQDEA